uniref:Vomeronasal type-1 receptor n=1 Tax=Capra hircus TaxID=9925 RepID=A0A8C2RL13_CAPHI
MSFQKDVLRTASQAALNTTYLLQMGVGSLVNVILFFQNIFPVLFGHKQRPTDTILTHMALANLLVLLSSGIPHTMTAFVSSKPLSKTWVLVFSFSCFSSFFWPFIWIV